MLPIHEFLVEFNTFRPLILSHLTAYNDFLQLLNDDERNLAARGRAKLHGIDVH